MDNAPSVGVLRCSNNLVDARDKNIQQRVESLSLANALSDKSSKVAAAESAAVGRAESKIDDESSE